MLITNLYSCIYAFISLKNKNELYETIEFLKSKFRNNTSYYFISIKCTISQIFIFLTIQNFVALVFSLIMI